MKHRIAGRKLGRSTEHRLALLRNLSTSLFAQEKIRTTLGKAKEVRPFAERLVTLAKRETLHARRQVLRHIHDRVVVGKLFDTLSARYAQRPGGYTRIIKLGPRRGDNAEMAQLELVGADMTPAETAPPAKTEKASRAGGAKRRASQAAGAKSTPKPKPKPKAKKASAASRPETEKSASRGRAGKGGKRGSAAGSAAGRQKGASRQKGGDR